VRSLHDLLRLSRGGLFDEIVINIKYNELTAYLIIIVSTCYMPQAYFLKSAYDEYNSFNIFKSFLTILTLTLWHKAGLKVAQSKHPLLKDCERKITITSVLFY